MTTETRKPTIKAAVISKLTHQPGNQTFNAEKIASAINADATLPDVNTAQVKRALKDINHIKSDGRGGYKIKGRRVP
jgi:hypothetical protein